MESIEIRSTFLTGNRKALKIADSVSKFLKNRAILEHTFWQHECRQNEISVGINYCESRILKFKVKSSLNFKYFSKLLKLKISPN